MESKLYIRLTTQLTKQRELLEKVDFYDPFLQRKHEIY